MKYTNIRTGEKWVDGFGCIWYIIEPSFMFTHETDFTSESKTVCYKAKCISGFLIGQVANFDIDGLRLPAYPNKSNLIHSVN